MKKFTVAQLGPRMGYAVPTCLSRANALDAFMTDICANKGLIKLALKCLPKSGLPSSIKRLAGRLPPDIPTNRIKANTVLGLSYALQRNAFEKRGESALSVFLDHNIRFGNWCVKRIPSTTEAVYGFNSASVEIFRWAKRNGISTVLEQTIAPRKSEITLLQRAGNEHPQWIASAERKSDNDLLRLFCSREEEEWRLADKIICGSPFVLDQLASHGVPREKIEVVPYGVDTSQFGSHGTRSKSPTSSPLRILSIGVLSLRKGTPYLLQALSALGSKVECRLIGPLGCSADLIKDLPPNTKYHGILPRSELGKFYEWADIFVLPSLCEGSATVTYEALLSGVPVLCTPNTGSIIENNKNGILVPAFECQSLTDSLLKLCHSPDLLQHLQIQAAATRSSCTLHAYSDRLIKTLSLIH